MSPPSNRLNTTIDDIGAQYNPLHNAKTQLMALILTSCWSSFWLGIRGYCLANATPTPNYSTEAARTLNASNLHDVNANHEDSLWHKFNIKRPTQGQYKKTHLKLSLTNLQTDTSNPA